MESGRVECPHATHCGGCALIEHGIAAQHRSKEKRLARALEPYPALSTLTRDPIRGTDEVTRYRTRTKLMIDAGGAIGLFAPNSHSVIDIPDCQVMSETTRATIAALRPLLAGSGVEAVDVREAQDQAGPQQLVTLIAGVAAVEPARELAKNVAALPHVASVSVSARDKGAVHLLGRDLELRSGEPFLRDRMHPSLPFVHASPGSFVQAHRGQAHALQSHVIDQLEHALGGLSSTRIVELHCGEGGLGFRLAQLGANVLMVDSFEPAIARLREAASAQQLTVEAWAHDATDALTRLLELRQPVDAVILDPPRRGVPTQLRRLLADLKPRAVVYVSCGPESFARDLGHLAWLGYSASRVTPLDLIPLSAEVESVALLVPSSPPALAVLYEDEQVLIVDKPPNVPTTPQGEHTVSLLEVARKQFREPALTAVHRLDAGTSGVCILARKPEYVRAWSQALAAGEKKYQALVRGIPRDKGTIKRALRDSGRMLDARTRYKRVEVVGGHSLVIATPDEGRTHQIRRHLASIKHAVLGDSRYGDAKSNRHLEHKHGLDRTFLHCAKITLVAPTTGTQRVIETGLPGDLKAVLASMRGPGVVP